MSSKLKNIRFKSAVVQILSIEHIPRILVTWELEPTTQNLSQMKFFIDRWEGDGATTELTGVGLPALTSSHEFVDYSAKLLDLNKIYYYQIRAVEFFNGTPVQTFKSDPVTWDGDLDLVGLYVVEEHLFAHRHVYGVPALVYKKRRDGARCPSCWDPVMKRPTKSNCTACFGTGVLEGYYDPIPVWMSFEPHPKTAQIVDWGEKQNNQTDIQFTNYPTLSVDDVIVELRNTQFWKVSNIRPAEKNRAITLQIARINMVYRSDIEYKIEVSEDLRREMVTQLESRKKEREF